MRHREARFQIGQVVRHRIFPFRGVVFDVDPEFANTEEWWNAIPAEIRPSKDQPILSPFRRECGDRVHCLCQRAEPLAR